MVLLLIFHLVIILIILLLYQNDMKKLSQTKGWQSVEKCPLLLEVAPCINQLTTSLSKSMYWFPHGVGPYQKLPLDRGHYCHYSPTLFCRLHISICSFSFQILLKSSVSVLYFLFLNEFQWFVYCDLNFVSLMP